jgi:Flp pilus assembly protein TadG
MNQSSPASLQAKECRVATVKRESGQDLVEFALIAPFLFAVLFGIIEFGVAIWRYNTLANTARETVREFIVYPSAERAAPSFKNTVEEYAVRYARDVAGIAVTSSYDDTPIVITSTEGISRTLPRLVVTVNYTHETITGLFGPIPMEAKASMLAEVWD